MKTVFHSASSRGHNDLGWLTANHSFSFGQYYNPDKVHFGALRVLNDDIIVPGKGFGQHPHDNMEIITIPLKGKLEHRDTLGTHSVIESGEVQVMSAGNGIQHSEFNADTNEPINLLQIWVMPEKRNITPRYDQRRFDKADRINKLQVVVSPDEHEGLWVNQQTWFSIGNPQKDVSLSYTLRGKAHGVYVFVIEGTVKIGDQTLGKRDALGISETTNFSFTALEDAEVLLLEVPMQF